jgi:hypothetical protein
MRGMMWWMVVAMFFAGGEMASAIHAASRDSEVALYGPSFPVGDLQFTIPSKWKIEMVDSPARGGQWRVPPLHAGGEGGEVVVFYFGTRSNGTGTETIGGTAKENIEAWIGTIFNAEGHPAAAEVKHRQVGAFKISQVVIFGTYNQVVSLPGVPPVPKSNYGLLGAVIENPGGNIYWRFTGPEALITANLPLFNKIIDSVRPQDNKPPAP